MYLNQVSQQQQQAQAQQQQMDPYSVAQLQQQQQQVLAAQQAALYGNGNNSSNIDALDIPQQPQNGMGHQQSASISGMNGFQNGNGNTPSGLLAPPRSHNRAVSLPVFAQQINGFQEANGNEQRGRGHQYQNSFSGGLGNGAGFANGGYGLAIQDGGMNVNGLNGWAEEEVVTN